MFTYVEKKTDIDVPGAKTLLTESVVVNHIVKCQITDQTICILY